ERAVITGRRHAVADERVDLILHERDERRDHHREPFSHERGGLKANRFPAARGQDDERVAAGKNRVHRFLLQRSERGVAPVALEHFEQRGGRWPCAHGFGSGQRYHSPIGGWSVAQGLVWITRSRSPCAAASAVYSSMRTTSVD